jgi:hypothetical protein
MINFKEIMLKNLSKINVVHSIPGRVRLKVPFLDKVPPNYRLYDNYILEAIKILHGVENLSINYVLGTALITYNTENVYEQKILNWIDEIVNVCINNLHLFEKYGETNLKYVVGTLEHQLRDKVKMYN